MHTTILITCKLIHANFALLMDAATNSIPLKYIT